VCGYSLSPLREENGEYALMSGESCSERRNLPPDDRSRLSLVTARSEWVPADAGKGHIFNGLPSVGWGSLSGGGRLQLIELEMFLLFHAAVCPGAGNLSGEIQPQLRLQSFGYFNFNSIQFYL